MVEQRNTNDWQREPCPSSGADISCGSCGTRRKNRLGRLRTPALSGAAGPRRVRWRCVPGEEMAWPEDTWWRDTGTDDPIGRGIVGVHTQTHRHKLARTHKNKYTRVHVHTQPGTFCRVFGILSRRNKRCDAAAIAAIAGTAATAATATRSITIDDAISAGGKRNTRSRTQDARTGSHFFSVYFIIVFISKQR